LLGSLRVVEGLCVWEGCPDGLKVYLFSLSGSVLVLSLVTIGSGRGGCRGSDDTNGYQRAELAESPNLVRFRASG